MKSRDGKSKRREAKNKKDQRRESQKEEGAGAWKCSNIAKHCIFPMLCGTRGSASRLAKAAGAEPAGQMRDEELHTIVARSKFPSQKAQKNTPFSDYFWKLRCRKSARRCGANHMSKAKEIMTDTFGTLLEVEIEKVHAVGRNRAKHSSKPTV